MHLLKIKKNIKDKYQNNMLIFCYTLTIGVKHGSLNRNNKTKYIKEYYEIFEVNILTCFDFVL